MIAGQNAQVHRRRARRLPQGRAQAPDDARASPAASPTRTSPTSRAYYEQLGRGRRGGGDDVGRPDAAGAEPSPQVAALLTKGELRLVPRHQLSAADRPVVSEARRPARRLPVRRAEGVPDRQQPGRRPQQRDHDGHGTAVHASRDQGDRPVPRLAAGRPEDRSAVALSPLGREVARPLKRFLPLALAGALRVPGARRADAALGEPGRPADHGPALAERVHDQHDERPGLRAADQPRPAAEDRSRPGDRMAAGRRRCRGASSCARA